MRIGPALEKDFVYFFDRECDRHYQQKQSIHGLASSEILA